MFKTILTSALALVSLASPLLSRAADAASDPAQMIHVVAVEVDGTKFWLPSTITVKKGDHVRIHAMSKVPGAGSVHGFAIDAFKIQEVVDAKGKEINFVADKAGIFPIRCQLHPAHIGGQLVVLE